MATNMTMVKASTSAVLTLITPRGPDLSNTVSMQVSAPVGTTDVRFSLNGIQVSELTNQYAVDTKTTPIWKTFFDTSWFPPGQYQIRGLAYAPEGVLTATLPVVLSRAQLPAGAAEGAAPPAAQTSYNDSQWATIVVPDSLGEVDRQWMMPNGLLGVYRRTFQIEQVKHSRRYFILSDS